VCAGADIRELISLEDVMEELHLGPNGGLIHCMEYLEENLEDWLADELENFAEDDYIVSGRFCFWFARGRVHALRGRGLLRRCPVRLSEQGGSWMTVLVFQSGNAGLVCSIAGQIVKSSNFLTQRRTIWHMLGGACTCPSRFPEVQMFTLPFISTRMAAETRFLVPDRQLSPSYVDLQARSGHRNTFS
jgi:hypothetical protein